LKREVASARITPRFRNPGDRMNLRASLSPTGTLPRAALALAVALFALPGQAQFKVIGSDGKVTYTDREPNAAEGKVVPLGNRAVVPLAPAEPELPFDLRQIAGKYPVTLYVTSGACEPCSSGRQMLKQRGIPFSERLVVSAEDSEALERLTGAREAPTLAIGSQILRGYAVEVWSSYLDAAGYPRDSKLPSSYQYKAATPVVERREATTARAESRPQQPALPVPSPAPGGIRF
jgi:glutaredoxin